MRKINYLAMSTLLLTFSSCRLVDFTVISSKNVSINFKKDVMRQKGVDFSVKGAMDKAIQKGGLGYDGLVDGVIYDLPFFLWKVEGTPIKSSEIQVK